METETEVVYSIEEWCPVNRAWESCNKTCSDNSALGGLITYWRLTYPETDFRLVQETRTTRREIVG
jgi:hypothetical protein